MDTGYWIDRINTENTYIIYLNQVHFCFACTHICHYSELFSPEYMFQLLVNISVISQQMTGPSIKRKELNGSTKKQKIPKSE